MNVSLMVVSDPFSNHQTKKNVVKVGPPLTKLSGSAHALTANEANKRLVLHMRTRMQPFITS